MSAIGQSVPKKSMTMTMTSFQFRYVSSWSWLGNIYVGRLSIGIRPKVGDARLGTYLGIWVLETGDWSGEDPALSVTVTSNGRTVWCFSPSFKLRGLSLAMGG